MSSQREEDQRRERKKRRAFIGKCLVGGSAVGLATNVPGRWVPPVVESVILPAHAQTSPGESLSNGTFEGVGGAEVAFNGSASLLDSLISPAHAASGARIHVIVCIQNGEFDVSFLEVEDGDDSDAFSIFCTDVVGINGNGKVDGRRQEVASTGSGTPIGTVNVKSSSPGVRVSVDLLENDISIRGSFEATFVGKACKKVAKKGLCKVTGKKKAKKTTSLRGSGNRRVSLDEAAPRRSIRRTRRTTNDKPTYRVVRSRSGLTRNG